MRDNRWNSRWLRAGAMLMVAGLFTACASDPSSKQHASGTPGASTQGAGKQIKDMRISFANINNQAEFFAGITAGMRTAAKVSGAEVNYYDNKSDGNTTLQNAQLMVQDHPDLIVEYYGSEGVSRAAEQIFEKAGIPCITLNVPGAGYCHWFNLYNPLICADTGRLMGELANKRQWTAENTKILLVGAASFGAEINTCQGYFYEQLQKYMPDIKQIASYKDITLSTAQIGETGFQVNGDGLLDKTFTAVTNVLQAIPDSQNLIVYPIGDDMAIGALRALDRAGRSSRTMIAGLGGDPRALAELEKNPSWVGEGDVFFSNWGEYVQAMAQAVVNHAEVPDLTTSPLAVLSKDQTLKDTLVAPITDYYKPGQTVATKLPPLVQVQENDLPGKGSKGTVGNGYLADTGVLQLFNNVSGVS